MGFTMGEAAGVFVCLVVCALAALAGEVWPLVPLASLAWKLR